MTPVLLIPGLACTAEIFAPQIAALWPLGPVTIASTCEGDTMASIAASILKNAPPRFSMAGISMGGYLCFEILRQAPDRVEKLALLDTSAKPDTPEASEKRRALVARARKDGVESVMAELFPALVRPIHAKDETLLALVLRMARDVGVEAFARQENAIMTRPDSRPLLASITQPSVIIVGAEDQLTPPALAQEMASAIPGANLVVIPEAGHLSTCEQPARVNAALATWLRA